jgi:hypothetical protein
MQSLELLGLLLRESSDPLTIEDQIKMSFIILFGAFCYTTMPFRLKSAGAMYQRLS